MERPDCAVCGTPLAFRWTDSHGIGVCVDCGCPYKILHYEDGEPLERPPTLLLKPEGVEFATRYWNEKRRMVYPTCFDFGILSHRDASYSGATHDDLREWEEWMGAQEQTLASDERSTS